MLTLVTLVEKALSSYLSGTWGSFMYDACTDRCVQYLCVFGVYMQQVKVMQLGTSVVKKELAMPHISVSPMAMANGNDSDSDSDSDS